MSDAPRPTPPRAIAPTLQVIGIMLTSVAALASSAALAWGLRHWREGRESSPTPPPSLPAIPSLASTAPGSAREVLLRAGRLAFHVHCARCHGSEGHGDGADAERLIPPPRDFASASWRLGPTPAAVRQAIVAGIPGTAMPGWGASLSPRELDGLVAYVLSLAPSSPSRETPDADAPLPSTLQSLLSRAGFVAEAAPRPAPALLLRDLDGKTASSDDCRGRPLLVLFWGTTCGHCLTELPAAIRFVEKHRAAGLDLLPICVDEADASVIRAVAGPQPGNRPLYVDPDGTARHRYDIQALPTLVLLDVNGRLIARAAGARDWTDPALEDLVREMLMPVPAEPSGR